MKQNLFLRSISTLLILCVLLGLMTALSQIAVAETISTDTAEIDALFTARSAGQHPRVLANNEDFARIRNLINTDDYMRVTYTRLYDYCVQQISKPVSVYNLPDGVRLLNISKEASQRIVWMAMVYQLSGERRFAERAIEELMAVCAFPDWHPKHYLDVGRMAYGVGIGYDWLYYELTASQRKTIETAV